MNKIIAERYELLDVIGRGGMADVYLANDTILNRTIAILFILQDSKEKRVQLRLCLIKILLKSMMLEKIMINITLLWNMFQDVL